MADAGAEPPERGRGSAAALILCHANPYAAMLYYYKRPGDWLWTPHETSSLAADIACGRVAADARYRISGEAEVYSLAEVLVKERASLPKDAGALSEAEAELLAPDGTWGVLTVIMCCAVLALVVFVPSREGASPSSKWFLVYMAVTWLGRGIAQITAAREWKRNRARKSS